MTQYTEWELIKGIAQDNLFKTFSWHLPKTLSAIYKEAFHEYLISRLYKDF